tara:strand:+ start:267 stop:473 length:207 start_codon:yes stop_codon:yes gene_type:complete
LDVWSIVEWNDTKFVDLFLKDRDITRGLQNLPLIVVAARHNWEWAIDETSVAKVHVFGAFCGSTPTTN